MLSIFETILVLQNNVPVVAAVLFLMLFFIFMKNNRKTSSPPPSEKLSTKVAVINEGNNTISDDKQEVRSDRINSFQKQSPCIATASISCNTSFDLDDFLVRMYKTGFFVHRVKDGIAKARCIVVNENCEFCMYKDVRPALLSAAFVAPYATYPMTDLRDSFQCDGPLSPNFILEFRSKTIHFTAPSALDAAYLAEGFKAVVGRLRFDKLFPEHHAKLVRSEPSKYSHNSALRKLACTNFASGSGGHTPQKGNTIIFPSPKKNFTGASSSGSGGAYADLDDYSVSTAASLETQGGVNGTPQSRIGRRR